MTQLWYSTRIYITYFPKDKNKSKHINSKYASGPDYGYREGVEKRGRAESRGRVEERVLDWGEEDGEGSTHRHKEKWNQTPGTEQGTDLEKRTEHKAVASTEDSHCNLKWMKCFSHLNLDLINSIGQLCIVWVCVCTCMCLYQVENKLSFNCHVFIRIF